MDMKHLKVASPAWAGYTGTLGPHMFVDGVSVDPLPRHMRDRLAVGMQFLEINEDGTETPAGSVHRLVMESAARIEPVEPLKRQTEEEKKAEQVEIALAAAKAAPDIFTRAELEDIASKGGIKALREVSAKWNVKHRSIPVLIEAVLVEQEKFLAKRNQKIAAAAIAELEAKGIVSAPVDAEAEKLGNPDSAIGADDDIPTTIAGEQTELDLSGIDLAAATGDLSAALNGDETLIGSSTLASTYEIKGETVSLGDLVMAAHDRSGSTVAEWNSLPVEDRDDLIRLELDRRLAE